MTKEQEIALIRKQWDRAEDSLRKPLLSDRQRDKWEDKLADLTLRFIALVDNPQTK